MIKIKHIFYFALVSVLLYSCGDDNAITDPFADIDHKALALSDNDSLVKFLKAHYYDTSLDSVKPLVTGKIALFDDSSNLITMDAKRNGIDYKLYVYKVRNGNPIDPVFGNSNDDKGYPTVSDSLYTKYSGQTIVSSIELSTKFDSKTKGFWASYERLGVRGWSFGFKNFKGGYLKKNSTGGVYNGPITYLEGGKGVLFIPSGLAYTSIDKNNYRNSLVNRNLMFYIELLDFVKDTDHDNDGVSSYLEDANNDGDLENDFSDPKKPIIPDYLNKDIK